MQSKNSVGARIGMLVFATSGIQFANGFFGTFIALRVALAFARGAVRVTVAPWPGAQLPAGAK